jgi:hypothetical protein
MLTLQSLLLPITSTLLLCVHDSSSKSALAQAELDYQKSNIDSQIAIYFAAPPQQYSIQQFVDFIMGAHVCLSIHTSIKRMSNIAYSSLQLISNNFPSCPRAHNTEDKDGPQELYSSIINS